MPGVVAGFLGVSRCQEAILADGKDFDANRSTAYPCRQGVRLSQARRVQKRQAMIEVWGRKNSFNVQKVLWCCEELDVPYRRHDAGGLFGGTDEDEYLAANPTGLVPTISDDGFTLWESNTIVRYLAAKHGAGTLWPEDPAERPRGQVDGLPARHALPHLQDALLGLVRTPRSRDDEKIQAAVRARPASARLG